MRKQTWKALDWPALGDRVPDGEIGLSCPNCGQYAGLPTCGPSGSTVIASIGLSLIFDDPNNEPPEQFMPALIQCRACRNVFPREIRHA